MSGYTKLFSDILVSTVWELPLATKVVWITMLAMKDKHGEIRAAVPGLAKMAGVTVAQCEEALASFRSPDPHSRTKDHEGRRIEDIDGGWRLLNADKYRDMLSDDDQRDKARIRKKRQRDKMGQDGTSKDETGKSRHTDTDPDPDKIPLNPPSGEYPAEFESLWAGTGRLGTKFKAFRAWKKVGKPTWNAIGSVWSAYLLSKRPQDGFVMDLSSWLNGRGFTQQWIPATKRPASTYCAFHQKPNSRGRPSYGPVPSCPECKHVASGATTRQSEPASMADVLAAQERFLREKEASEAGGT